MRNLKCCVVVSLGLALLGAGCSAAGPDEGPAPSSKGNVGTVGGSAGTAGGAPGGGTAGGAPDGGTAGGAPGTAGGPGGGSPGGAASCTPAASVPAFTSTYKAPVSNGANKCSDAQLTEMARVCFSATSTAQACDTFLAAAANQTCAACLVLPDVAPQHGPLIPGFGVNLYGCIALAENNLTATSCASKIHTSDDCASRACAACTDPDAFGRCQNASATGACKAYVDASNACAPALPQAAYDCLPAANDTQESWAKRVAARFCGPR